MIVGSGGAGPTGARTGTYRAASSIVGSLVPGRTRVGSFGGQGPRRPSLSEEVVPQQAGPAQPKGLLQQMEELMAALNADLSALDADLQSAGASAAPAVEGEAG